VFTELCVLMAVLTEFSAENAPLYNDTRNKEHKNTKKVTKKKEKMR